MRFAPQRPGPPTITAEQFANAQAERDRMAAEQARVTESAIAAAIAFRPKDALTQLLERVFELEARVDELERSGK
jgi:hypothetical protein